MSKSQVSKPRSRNCQVSSLVLSDPSITFWNTHSGAAVVEGQPVCLPAMYACMPSACMPTPCSEGVTWRYSENTYFLVFCYWFLTGCPRFGFCTWCLFWGNIFWRFQSSQIYFLRLWALHGILIQGYGIFWFGLWMECHSSEQLFVCYSGRSRGAAFTKQRISHWVRNAICKVCEACRLSLPLGICANITRGVASFQTFFRGESLWAIYVAAVWAFLHFFFLSDFIILILTRFPGFVCLSGVSVFHVCQSERSFLRANKPAVAP